MFPSVCALHGCLTWGCLALGHHDEALAVAERGRTRAFADLLVERQTGLQDSDPYSPVTVDQVLETVHGQRGLVLYYSLAAGYLYSWLLAPGAGRALGRATWGQGESSGLGGGERAFLLCRNWQGLFWGHLWPLLAYGRRQALAGLGSFTLGIQVFGQQSHSGFPAWNVSPFLCSVSIGPQSL